MEEQLSQFNIVSEQNNVLLNRQIEQLSNLLGHDVALVREHVAKQESLQQRTQKRHKIHFIIVYSMLFLSLMGLVFVYVYYAKLLRDYDLFQNKRINEVRNEHRLALESIRTDVTTRIDASVDEMMGEFLKIRQETDAFQQAIRNRVDDVEQQGLSRKLMNCMKLPKM
jgi:flagellar biosynthesis/type III secretory pathway M-ring protein FliF/YscJ